MRLRAYSYDWIVWGLFLALPLVIFWQAATSLEEQGVAGGGPMENAASFPRLIAWLLLGLAAVNGVRIALCRISAPSPLAPTPTTRLACVVTAVFVAYLLLLPWLGYHLATPVMMATTMMLLGLSIPVAVAGGVAISLLVAAVFQGLLNVVLPVGLFEITLFG
ncbi:tripartite tricarboxylate transporter TctB family protein [Pontivivens nitratireducens]|uniref:Tripartite tricarboxylate transporter TctB family protein n=1 Tax=Pontivivens nitratireducens TaxID=2758038 RepID=A0A6G7VKK6_9RHOB|nr:tripartite tricarboxylate transporter TctB family protein [Pontibrevibacter nitratireducens]QIK40472.1 tripartite tricarboxylate transporter TctB family protein [Pontibrevibacter nitratireducens]